MTQLALNYASLYSKHYGRTYATGIYRYSYELSKGLIQHFPGSLSFVFPQKPPEDYFDLFHSLFHAYPFPKWANNQPRLKKVVTLHDLIACIYPEYYPLHSTDFIQVKKMLKSDWFIVPSVSTRRDLISYGSIDPHRIFVTPLAACGKQFFPQFNFNTLGNYGIANAPYFLFVGRLEERKGVHTLLRAFKELVLQEKIEDLQLVLGGPLVKSYTQIYHHFQNEIVKPGLCSRVIHIPYIKNEDLPILYSHALGFTFLSDYEGFGLPPLEAMQCGTPTICLDNSSLPEVVGDAALLLENNRIETVSQALLSFYTQSQLVKKLSQKGLERAKLFSWEKTVQQTIQAYHSILNSD